MAEFVRSMAAQGAAGCIINTARQLSLLTGPITVDPVLAEAEKELIVKMLTALHDRFPAENAELEQDQISSLFTFVFAKAAEAVTNMFNHQPNKFELTGMLDGRIPVYAEEKITAQFKESNFPFFCAKNYLEWCEADAEALRDCDKRLLLFEALKWCFRLSCHQALLIVEAMKKRPNR